MTATGPRQLGSLSLDTVPGKKEVGMHLHQVTEAFLAENIPQEAHLFLVIGVWSQLRGQQGQSLMESWAREDTEFIKGAPQRNPNVPSVLPLNILLRGSHRPGGWGTVGSVSPALDWQSWGYRRQEEIGVLTRVLGQHRHVCWPDPQLCLWMLEESRKIRHSAHTPQCVRDQLG